IAALGVGDTVRALRADVTRPPKADSPCSLILLDPPYGKELASRALPALVKAGWCAPGAVAVVEEGDGAPFDAGEAWEALQERRSGPAVLRFLRLKDQTLRTLG
ncbi:MAG TPA: RsmD family RNA methyltransferase, partial [Azospirillaceae bacterium]|nr:RsmD family RNA methyltransferase [Azospirillaceae bacterium]